MLKLAHGFVLFKNRSLVNSGEHHRVHSIGIDRLLCVNLLYHFFYRATIHLCNFVKLDHILKSSWGQSWGKFASVMKEGFENEVVERLMSTQSPNIVIGVEHLIYCCLSMFVKIADVKRTRFNVVLLMLKFVCCWNCGYCWCHKNKIQCCSVWCW